jgi:hypothetical protein
MPLSARGLVRGAPPARRCLIIPPGLLIRAPLPLLWELSQTRSLGSGNAIAPCSADRIGAALSCHLAGAKQC